jgi:hypothetical protein
MKKDKLSLKNPSNETAKEFFLPLTSSELIALRGKPTVFKMIKPSSTNNSEWIYFNTDNEEHYFFKDEELVRWEKIPFYYSMKGSAK